LINTAESGGSAIESLLEQAVRGIGGQKRKMTFPDGSVSCPHIDQADEYLAVRWPSSGDLMNGLFDFGYLYSKCLATVPSEFPRKIA